jgi:hypothetical protein
MLCWIDGELAVADWKTSTGIHAEYLLQTAAYVGALEEELGLEITCRYIIRLDKETGEFEARRYDKGEKDFEAFLAARTLYERLRELEAK